MSLTIKDVRPVLDHVVINVMGRLDEAAAQYQRLGFQLTERGYHTLGSSNNLAIFGDRIFGTTNNAHVVALEARTGKVVWSYTIGDQKKGYQNSSGPLAINGKIIEYSLLAPGWSRRATPNQG